MKTIQRRFRVIKMVCLSTILLSYRHVSSWIMPIAEKHSIRLRALSINSFITSYEQIMNDRCFFPFEIKARRSVNAKSFALHFSSSTENYNVKTILSDDDRGFLAEALKYAKIGFGYTFPNPAVGCVIVRQDTGSVIGTGFHPRAGLPHAEVFALLEAAGHIKSGVASAVSVLNGKDNDNDDNLRRLIDIYTGGSSNSTKVIGDAKDERSGPDQLFGDCFKNIAVTAYVTLEPCCHHGRTPPCAVSLAIAKVDRVVIGYQDPNPRVDGGGCKVLTNAGVVVDLINDDDCGKIVDSFVKRIQPKDYDDVNFSHITGAHRRSLRRIANRRKHDKSLEQVSWNGRIKAQNEEETDNLALSTNWMEELDAMLWKEEIVNVRLNKAVQKKKLAKRLGERIATSLGAHLAQNVGHTVLLYREGIPKQLDLNDEISNDSTFVQDDNK